MLKQLFEYRKHNPFDKIEDEKEKIEFVKKYLNENYYTFNFAFLTSICALSILVLYVIIFKGIIPKEVLLASIKNVYSFETIIVNTGYCVVIFPVTLVFMYFSDKCISLRLYAEKTYNEIKNKKL